MAAPAPSRSTAEATIVKQFEALKALALALAQSPSRTAAFERFAASGLPTRRVESWHYTDLRAAMSDAAPLLGLDLHLTKIGLLDRLVVRLPDLLDGRARRPDRLLVILGVVELLGLIQQRFRADGAQGDAH